MLEKEYLVYAMFFGKDNNRIETRGINIRGEKTVREYDIVDLEEYRNNKNKKAI